MKYVEIKNDVVTTLTENFYSSSVLILLLLSTICVSWSL